MKSDSRGQIITFYSYKGGTGRSMALSNIACILAERQAIEGGKGVLMIDWDLEAPGLHRYFQNRLATSKLSLGRPDSMHDEKPGLIDLFYELNVRTDYYLGEQAASTSPEQTLTKEQLATTAIEAVDLQQYILPTTLKGLDLIKSGRFSQENPNEYSERVNKFNWEALYTKSPHLIRLFAERLAQDYAYVLIDSRTGVTDISGICTMLLPEKLVVVFTPNLQSLKGGLDLIRRATDYRKESADLRPLVVFPLVSRVEMSEPELRHEWRFGNKDTKGYQPEFEKALAEVYGKDNVRLDQYFDQMQIQHIPKYAYGEEIAVLIEKTWDKFSLRRGYRTFADKLIDSHSPWEGEINDDISSEAGVSGFAPVLTSITDLLSLSGTSKLIRSAIVVILLLVGAFALLFSVSQSRRAEGALADAEQARVSNATLAEKNNQLEVDLRELREQSPSIIQKLRDDNKTLNDQLTSLTTEANKAKQDVLTANNSAAQATRAMTQAQSDAKAARQAAEVERANSVNNARLNKDYLDQIRGLKLELAKCNPKANR